MDVDSIQQTAHTPYYGPWSAWSPWRTICRLGMIVWQTRQRSREVGETWSQRTHHESCDPIELPIVGTIWLQTVTDGPWEAVSQTSTVTQREYRTVSLLDISQWRPWKMAVLPTVYRGDRLRLDWRGLAEVLEVKSYTAELDGQTLEDDELVLGDELGEGHHAIDFHVETADGAQRYQVTFATTARFAAWFPKPIVELRLPKAGRPNGAKLALVVANRSRDTVSVRPAVLGVPAGWKAVFLDESPTKLGPGRERQFGLQVEAMTDAAIRRGAQPLTVAIRAVGLEEGADEIACASCVLQVTGDAKTIARIEGECADRMRRHRPLLDIPLDDRRTRNR